MGSADRLRARPGSPGPLGATWDGLGTNFSLYSRHATGVRLELFADPGEKRPRATVTFEARTGHVWHAYVPDVGPGSLYGYRVDGPWDPAEGHVFNSAKLVQDPWARALCGEVVWTDALAGRRAAPSRGAVARDTRDNATLVPRSVVVDGTFPWDGDTHPATPLDRTVVYECHVKGMTMLHPDVPEELRGTYLGLSSEPVIEHLQKLGVTAVELLPVHHRVSEGHLAERGLTNYWGYNTLGYFAPDARFARSDRGEQVTEFKAMVKGLHRAGIEVILDVVYNHTAEGGPLGPTLSLRGVDNASYYQLDPTDRSRNLDATGCGNTVEVNSPPGLWLLMDSLRYWVEEMHVDGFRFDLATALAREEGELRHLTRVFDVVRQDPVLSETKLIVEPWDVLPDGFQLGGYPEGYSEWNSRYRDGVRRFWRGDRGQVGELASRLSGSSDVFGGRTGPLASLNFITAHDGFTLADLVSYERKHNARNGEEGRDGSDANWSANWGTEGPTDEEAILRGRDRVARSLVATLAFSQGVPMLSHGDELLREQGGNNNAYCHDDETTWVSWSLDARRRAFLDFTRAAFALRARHPALRRARFFVGADGDASSLDVAWLHKDGHEMTPADWNRDDAHVVGMRVTGEDSAERDARGRPTPGETLLLVVNGGPRAVRFVLPETAAGSAWHLLLATDTPGGRRRRSHALRVAPHAFQLLALQSLG